MDRKRLSKVYTHMPNRQPVKVTFPSLDHFLEDITDLNIDTVRLDVFQMVRPSELSFVYYVTWTLYVTAQDPETCNVYEYAEPLTTLASADPNVKDEAAATLAKARIEEVEKRLEEMVSRVKRGRYVIDSEEKMEG